MCPAHAEKPWLRYRYALTPMTLSTWSAKSRRRERTSVWVITRIPEATSAAFTADGFLKTGDLGIIDAHGNIFIKGRSKSMILSANGQNIYPEEVEAVVNNQDYVVESVVVDRASKLVALVYLDHDAIRKAGLDDRDHRRHSGKYQDQCQ